MSDIPDAGPQPITLDDVGLDARGICGHQLPEGTHLFTVDSLAAALMAEADPDYGLPDMFVKDNAANLATAIIQAAKEASDFDHPDLGTFALRQEAERE